MDKTRTYFAEKYLLGDGVEFGALHNPLIVGEQSQITYVDKLTKKELLKKFPELKDYAESIVSTDIILDIDSIPGAARASGGVCPCQTIPELGSFTLW